MEYDYSHASSLDHALELEKSLLYFSDTTGLSLASTLTSPDSDSGEHSSFPVKSLPAAPGHFQGHRYPYGIPPTRSPSFPSDENSSLPSSLIYRHTVSFSHDSLLSSLSGSSAATSTSEDDYDPPFDPHLRPLPPLPKSMPKPHLQPTAARTTSPRYPSKSTHSNVRSYISRPATSPARSPRVMTPPELLPSPIAIFQSPHKFATPKSATPRSASNPSSRMFERPSDPVHGPAAASTSAIAVRQRRANPNLTIRPPSPYLSKYTHLHGHGRSVSESLVSPSTSTSEHFALSPEPEPDDRVHRRRNLSKVRRCLSNSVPADLVLRPPNHARSGSQLASPSRVQDKHRHGGDCRLKTEDGEDNVRSLPSVRVSPPEEDGEVPVPSSAPPAPSRACRVLSMKWIREERGRRWVEENYSEVLHSLRSLR
ncbi:hypothetical protein OF83DRAFT_1079938 [Amylostereum chailletii]|nr:hypothetical protein OF83DRAFT_1079938 [Amylostereum chailletii]